MRMGIHVTQLEKKMFPVSSPLDYDPDAPEIIDTRFGKIELQRQAAFSFPRGLLGMAEKKEFFITEFPSEKLARFKLLQSLDDYGLAFITLPVAFHNDIIASEDLQSACQELGIHLESLIILMVVSVHRSPARVSLSINARAPLLIDSRMRLAAQYVFMNDKYQVQHPIS